MLPHLLLVGHEASDAKAAECKIATIPLTSITDAAMERASTAAWTAFTSGSVSSAAPAPAEVSQVSADAKGPRVVVSHGVAVGRVHATTVHANSNDTVVTAGSHAQSVETGTSSAPAGRTSRRGHPSARLSSRIVGLGMMPDVPCKALLTHKLCRFAVSAKGWPGTPDRLSLSRADLRPIRPHLCTL